jgi:hypothetical protein
MPKWSVDAVDKNLADVDPDSVDNMYDPAIGLPPKGPYLCAVRFIKVGVTGEKSNSPGDAKIWVKAEISEPAGTVKAKYNGYELHKHQNVAMASEAGRVNQILLALLDNTKLNPAKKKAVLTAFHARQVVVDDKDNITKIGTWTLPEGLKVGIVTRGDTDQNGDKSLGVGSFMPPSQAPKGIPADEVEVDEEDDDNEPEEGEEDPDEEVAARQEELEGYTLAKLKTLAKSLKIKVPRGADEETLINLILDEEFPPEDEEEPEGDEAEDESEEDEDEADEEDEEADEEGDALDDMDRAALRVEAKALEIRVLKSMSDDDLRNALREAGWEGEPAEEAEEEDEEPEPEPVKKPARRGAASPAPKGRAAEKRRNGTAGKDPADDEPPF